MKERKKFFVLESLEEPSDVEDAVKTFHLENDRVDRWGELPDNIGKPVYSFVVDTAHPNGYEIHTLTEDGLIFIQNEKTKKLVTFLFARPQQIRRYFQNLGEKLPNNCTFNLMMKFANLNERTGRNYK